VAPETGLRAEVAEVAEQLTIRSASGGPFHREAAECTEYRYGTDVSRARMYKQLIPSAPLSVSTAILFGQRHHPEDHLCL